MNALVASALPESPPSHFERKDEAASHDTWLVPIGKPLAYTISRGFSDRYSSSFQPGSIEILLRLWQESPASTSANRSIAESIAELLRAVSRATLVNTAKASENLFELRRLTGFTWERLSNLLKVERRTLHNWVKGGEIRDSNRRHIAETLKVLRYADRGTAEENAAALSQPSPEGVTPFEEIVAGRYAEARSLLSHGASRPSMTASMRLPSLDSRWGLIAMEIHEAASADDVFEPTPDEPVPASRPRRIKRG